MMLALARAVLANPDIILLDEPTNHLDVQKVQWLVNTVVGLTHATVLIVSVSEDCVRAWPTNATPAWLDCARTLSQTSTRTLTRTLARTSSLSLLPSLLLL